MDNFVVVAEGLSNLKELEDSRFNIRPRAAQALNKIARDGRVQIARRIRAQVHFPASYVAPGGKRLHVSKRASPNSLEARISARTRATSLARFVTGSPGKSSRGVHVKVGQGKAKFLKRAFLIKLPAGSADIDTKNNLGLAIRLRPGEAFRKKNAVRRVASGLYVLYGPSVDQVFRANDGDGVANEIVPELEDKLSTEFLRLLEL